MRSSAPLATAIVVALVLCTPAGCGGPAAQKVSGADDSGPTATAPAAAQKVEPKAEAKAEAPRVNANKRPGESDDAAASRLNEEGKALVRDGKYELALVKFRAALELFPLSNAIFNVGSMLYTLKRHAEAYPYLEQTLKQPLAAEQRKVVLRYRDDVLKAVAKTHKQVMAESNPPGATMELNSTPQPYPTPVPLLVPYGRVELVFRYPGFADKKVVLESTSAVPPKDISVRMARAVVSISLNLRCPEGADVFVDSQIRGYEKVSLTLSAGPHVMRCGKGSASKAFEREIKAAVDGPKEFDYHRDRR